MKNARMLQGLVATLALAAVTAAAASADPISGDVNHSAAEFVVTHLAISHVQGTIPVIAWSGVTGANDVPTSVTATLDVRAIDTKSSDRDSDLRGGDWFDVTKYPTMTFKSTSIKPGANGAFTMTGDLTMHGVTKPITLAGTVVGSMVDGHGRKHVGFSATGSLDRRDFGLTWGRTTPGGALIASNDVQITLNAEGVVTK